MQGMNPSHSRACARRPGRRNMHDGPSVQGQKKLSAIFTGTSAPSLGAAPHLQDVLIGRHWSASPAPGRCARRSGCSKGLQWETRRKAGLMARSGAGGLAQEGWCVCVRNEICDGKSELSELDICCR